MRRSDSTMETVDIFNRNSRVNLSKKDMSENSSACRWEVTVQNLVGHLHHIHIFQSINGGRWSDSTQKYNCGSQYRSIDSHQKRHILWENRCIYCEICFAARMQKNNFTNVSWKPKKNSKKYELAFNLLHLFGANFFGNGKKRTLILLLCVFTKASSKSRILYYFIPSLWIQNLRRKVWLYAMIISLWQIARIDRVQEHLLIARVIYNWMDHIISSHS